MQMTGVCKYCGQTYMVEVEEDEVLTQQDIDYRAMLACNCDEAIKRKLIETSRKKAYENIDALFEGMPELEELLKVSTDRIARGEICSVAIDTGTPVKASVKIQTNGQIKVERKETKKVSVTG